MTVKRPPRAKPKKRGDYLLDRQAQQTEIECDKAAAVLDRKAIQMSEIWGEDKLPELVSIQTAQKYASAIAKFNDAMQSGNPAEVAKRAGVCVRGLDAMHAEAEAAGQPRASGDFWQIPDTNYAVMRDGLEWRKCQKERPDLIFISLQEVHTALKACRIDNPIFAEIKRQFPQAEIKPLGRKADLEDEIPW